MIFVPQFTILIYLFARLLIVYATYHIRYHILAPYIELQDCPLCKCYGIPHRSKFNKVVFILIGVKKFLINILCGEFYLTDTIIKIELTIGTDKIGTSHKGITTIYLQGKCSIDGTPIYEFKVCPKELECTFNFLSTEYLVFLSIQIYLYVVTKYRVDIIGYAHPIDK